MPRRAGRLLATAGVLLLGLAACGPEDDRSRGQGAGADVGNRPADGTPVQLFNVDDRNARIYYDTPDDVPTVAAGEPMLEPTAIPPATPIGKVAPAATPASGARTPGATPAAGTPMPRGEADLATPQQTGGDASTGSAAPGTPTMVASPVGGEGPASPTAGTPGPTGGPAPTAAPAPTPPTVGT